MHDLDIVPGTAWSDPFTAGNVIVGADLGSNGLEDGPDMGPGLFCTAGHDARPGAGALLTPGYTCTQIENSQILQFSDLFFSVKKV